MLDLSVYPSQARLNRGLVPLSVFISAQMSRSLYPLRALNTLHFATFEGLQEHQKIVRSQRVRHMPPVFLKIRILHVRVEMALSPGGR